MKKLAGVLAGVALVALVATSPAQASIIPYDNGDDGYFLLDGPLGNPAAEEAFIEALVGGDVTYLNKYNYDTGFEGGGAVNPGGNFFDQGAAGGSNTKTISWDLTGSGFGANYVLIKDGTVDNPNPPPTNAHLYRLYVVTDDQFLIGGGDVSFLPDFNKNISHVSWFGSPAGVPDGGMTLTLLGCALVGLGALRRRFSV
jgi:hypothetical protein